MANFFEGLANPQQFRARNIILNPHKGHFLKAPINDNCFLSGLDHHIFFHLSWYFLGGKKWRNRLAGPF
jgi:hypothetical protein